MDKQFKSNQEMHDFVKNYVLNNNINEAKDREKEKVWVKKFGMPIGFNMEVLDYINFEEYAKIIIEADYNIDNLRSGLCDEFLSAYDEIKRG